VEINLIFSCRGPDISVLIGEIFVWRLIILFGFKIIFLALSATAVKKFKALSPTALKFFYRLRRQRLKIFNAVADSA
jgi:hypothetical protein